MVPLKKPLRRKEEEINPEPDEMPITWPEETPSEPCYPKEAPKEDPILVPG